MNLTTVINDKQLSIENDLIVQGFLVGSKLAQLIYIV